MQARLRSSAVVRALKSLPRRWPWLRVALDVQQRFGEVRGGELAASITLSSFLSLFPLLLLAIGVFGFFSANATDLPAQVTSKLGLSGAAAGVVTDAVHAAERSRRAASVVGLAGLSWSALGVVGSLQNAYNSVWQVRGRGLEDRAVGLAWIAGGGVIFIGSFALTNALRLLPAPLTLVGILGSLAVDLALFLWTSRVLPNRKVPWPALLPGAALGAIGLEVLKLAGSFYVPHAVATSSALYGSLGVIFAVIAWLFFFARLVVYAAVLNVVLWERRHGTVMVAIDVPQLPGVAPLDVTRAGQVSGSQVEVT